jgi:selenocysteine-specific elongation factor
VGTAELLASLVLLDRDELKPGEWTEAQLLLSRPAVATWSQPFVIRGESPVVTIGGGQVLDPNAPRLPRRDPRVLARLADLRSDDVPRRASAAVYFAGWGKWQPADWARTAGIDEPEDVCRHLIDSGELVEIAVSPTRTLRVHRDLLDELSAQIETTLGKMHDESPLRATIDRSRLISRFAWLDDKSAVEIVLDRMAAADKIRLTERGVALAGRGPQLSKRQRELAEEIVETYREAAFQPPSVEAIKSATARNQAAVGELIALAESEGSLVKISPEYYLHVDTERRLRDTLFDRLAHGEGLTVSQIREVLATTRKYAVPLCEYLDRIGFTRRKGDLRLLCDPPDSP